MLAFMSIMIGFLAQRSRMCFVAGFRDYFLIRDRELLIGLFSFMVTIWFLTSVFYSMNILRKGIPEYGDIAVQKSVEHIRVSFSLLGHRKGLFAFAEGRNGIAVHFTNPFLYVTFFGGLCIGMISTLSGGCVLRQHVLFAQGNMNALYFFIGFYCAVIIYYRFLFRFFVRLY